ncbi:MAG: MmgE/PrpD family protein [Gemmatimonadetes bacterium]|nr:MmgE/PrpD family protein [Gemmatimonadota bacterium]
MGSVSAPISLSRALVTAVRALPVTDRDLRGAERFVRDWLGCTVAGRSGRPGIALVRYGKGQADLESRVFLAAALAHVTETDDLHRASITHPGTVVVPTAVLLGRQLGVGGKAVLTAILAGYEVMLRVGEALGPRHYKIFHNTATAGVFGSAAAAASLLELSDEQWTWALGNAGTQAAGLWQFNEDATMSKPLHTGHAASAGLRAARLAREGFTGPARILEGNRGFFRGLCPDPNPDAVLRPASGWKLHETSLKPYASCRHTHPVVDAALELRDQLAGTSFPGNDTRVAIESYAVAVGLNDDPDPGSPYAAQFSLQFCAATALLHGAPGLAAFEPAALQDADLRALLLRTSVAEDRALSAVYPASWGGTVEVTHGGRAYRATRSAALGDPELPLSDAALDVKVRGLLEFGGLSAEAADRLLAACRALPENGPIEGLSAALL